MTQEKQSTEDRPWRQFTEEQEILHKEHPIQTARLARADRANPNKPRITMMHPVTDLKYYMDGYLRNNLDEVPRFLIEGWDCVIIVTGSGKVRIGKSSMAIQVAYYLAWLLNEEKKKKKLVPPDNPVPFDNTHIAFDPDAVMKLASEKPRNSVIVYDEGRAGLDSARAMENINKTMMDFFQECGQYGHVILIVLPDFFKLNETIAIPRSLFLINVYVDKNYKRGYFSFFNEHKKELLYIIGRKKWGTTSKYLSIDDNFHGRFTNYFPINKEIYEELKRKAIRKRRRTRWEKLWRYERDATWYLMNKVVGWTQEDIAKAMNSLPEIKITKEAVYSGVEKMKLKLSKEGIDNFGEDD